MTTGRFGTAWTTRLVLVAALVVALVATATAVPAPAPAAARVTPCSRGLVALTFDDGPSPAETTRLVRILSERRVPATFFVVGSRVRTAPGTARLLADRGFVVANHSWSHARLDRLSDAGIRAELTRTRSELRRHRVAQSRLMRPPYGAIDGRVRRVVRGLGMVPVLWTIDTRDWAGGTPGSIASSVLRRLRPHRTNVVLQHDGVRRSAASVAAVPRIVSGARARGYCFARLGADGLPAAPVPTLRASVTGAREARRVPGRVTLTLSEPTSRRVSVRLTTVGGSARSGADFRRVDRTVVFPVGSTRAVVPVPVVDDRIHERVERFTVRLTRPTGLRLGLRSRVVTIVSDDAKPPPPPPPAPEEGTATG